MSLFNWILYFFYVIVIEDDAGDLTQEGNGEHYDDGMDAAGGTNEGGEEITEGGAIIPAETTSGIDIKVWSSLISLLLVNIDENTVFAKVVEIVIRNFAFGTFFTANAIRNKISSTRRPNFAQLSTVLRRLVGRRLIINVRRKYILDTYRRPAWKRILIQFASNEVAFEDVLRFAETALLEDDIVTQPELLSLHSIFLYVLSREKEKDYDKISKKYLLSYLMHDQDSIRVENIFEFGVSSGILERTGRTFYKFIQFLE